MSLTTEYQLFLSFFGFVFSSKNISNALILKKIYIHIYIMTAVRVYLIPQRFCPELCPNCLTNKGEFFLWDTKCGSCSLLVLVYCAAAVCHSLCAFALKDEHVRFASFGFRWRTNATFSPVPCQIYFSLIPILFLLQVTKEMCRKPKIL